MTRLKTRRTLRLESLESRELLTGGLPTAQEQYMLELVNLARTNPTQMADWISSHIDGNDKATMNAYNTDLSAELEAIRSSTPTQPLAWNSTLSGTADSQSQYQADNEVQTHTGPNGVSLEQRLDAAGYTDRLADGENAYAYAKSVDHAMKAFLIDWGVASHGHRGNLLQPDTPADRMYNEVGIGIVATDPGSKVGPFVMTQDFGRRDNSQSELVGVVFKDQDGDHFYTPGEGQGGVTIEVDDASGEKVAETSTWGSGGYQIPLAPGSYKVTALVNNQIVRSQNVTIGDVNVKVDYDLSQSWQGGTLAAMTPKVQAPTPTPTPQPTPTPTPNQTQGQSQVHRQDQISNNNHSIQLGGPITPNADATWLSSWTWWKK
jgi:uncharacterized protein YkwD